MLPAFLELAPAISEVDAVFHCVYEKGAFGSRTGAEAIGLSSQGDLGAIGVVLLLRAVGAIGPTRLEVSEPREPFRCSG